ncbi:MAG: S8 family serine peptidase, partial [Anaerolineae bacterium]|nr:S8 family serine peptidase [Anaerolineae bacterium]
MKRFGRIAVLVLVVLAMSAVARPAPSLAGGEVRVLVQFAPGRGAAVRAALQGASGNIHYEFEDLNTFAVTLPEAALRGIERNPNVVLVEEDAPRYLMSQDTPYGVDMVQARDVWDTDRDGSYDAGAPTGNGVTVCIIDSGLYTGHEDHFSNSSRITGYGTDWSRDFCGHGTHVAGTIAAANNTIGVVGVSPNVSLYIVKVFGDDCAWAYSSTLVDATKRCAAAGADIISMSLGGTKASTTERRQFDTLYGQGVLSIAAAGNDGTTAYNYPASYSSVVSVAAIDEAMVVADFSQQNNQVELAAPGVAVLSTLPYVETSDLTVDGSS